MEILGIAMAYSHANITAHYNSMENLEEKGFERGWNWGFWIGGFIMWILANFIFPICC